MEKLHLGVARRIITPEVGCNLFGYFPDLVSTGVADDLTADAFCFKQGDKAAMMISLTLCEISNETASSLQAQISALTGIPADHIMISCTHTHSGPVTADQVGWGSADTAYMDNVFTPGVLGAAQEAASNLEPVTVGMAQGNSFVGINRREQTEKNTIKFGQNPWAPFDPRMTVLSFKGEDGAVVANMIHYGCHGTSAGHNHEITRDWSGVMVDTMEAKTGALTAYFNGCEGDVGPRISNGLTVGDKTMTYVYELGEKAARDALDIYAQIREYTHMNLHADAFEVRVPLKKRLDRDFATRELELFRNETIPWKVLKRRHLETVLQAHENNEPEQDCVRFTQTLIALGDCVMVSFPYELFSEIGLRISKYCPEQTVLAMNMTNGLGSYFITQDAVCRGGYEVNLFLYARPQPYCDDADFELIRSTVDNINAFFAPHDSN